MSIFGLHENVLGDYRDFVRSFFPVAGASALDLTRNELRHILAPAEARGFKLSSCIKPQDRTSGGYPQ